MRICHFLVVFLAILAGSNVLSAQDLIITVQNDTIHCKIQDTDDRFVYYITPRTKRHEYELISRREVRELMYDAESADPRVEKHKAPDPNAYEKVQIWGGLGLSRLISINSDIPEDFKDYDNRLRFGVYFQGGANFFVRENLGFGLIYEQSNYSNSVNVINTNTLATGVLSDNIRVQYLGANVAVRLELSDMSSFIQVNGGIGNTRYENNATVIHPLKIVGSGAGGHLDATYHLSMGLGIYILLSVGIKGIAVQNLELEFGDGFTPEEIDAYTAEYLRNPSLGVGRLELGFGFAIAF